MHVCVQLLVHSPPVQMYNSCPAVHVCMRVCSCSFTHLLCRCTTVSQNATSHVRMQLLIREWSPAISREVLAHWLDLMTAPGWIAREQILGAEARSR